jgi:hypothetical protein
MRFHGTHEKFHTIYEGIKENVGIKLLIICRIKLMDLTKVSAKSLQKRLKRFIR